MKSCFNHSHFNFFSFNEVLCSIHILVTGCPICLVIKGTVCRMCCLLLIETYSPKLLLWILFKASTTFYLIFSMLNRSCALQLLTNVVVFFNLNQGSHPSWICDLRWFWLFCLGSFVLLLPKRLFIWLFDFERHLM